MFFVDKPVISAWVFILYEIKITNKKAIKFFVIIFKKPSFDNKNWLKISVRSMMRKN